MKNTDHRPFLNYKHEKRKRNEQNLNKSSEIDKATATIAYFKIHPDFTIDRFYKTDVEPMHINQNDDKESSSNDEKKFKWSLDLSNIQIKKYYQQKEYFILVAVSRVDIIEDMKGSHKRNENNDGND